MRFHSEALSQRNLIVANWVSNTGDGLLLTAAPILAVSLTDDPLQIALINASAFLPWVILGIPGGLIADRHGGRRLILLVESARCVFLFCLAGVALLGWLDIWMLAVGLFALGVGQVLFDSTIQARLPAIAGEDRNSLTKINGQLAASQTVGREFVGGPLGGFAVSASPMVPFLIDAVSFLASALLLRRFPRRQAIAVECSEGADAVGHKVLSDLKAGLRVLVADRPVFALTLVTGLNNAGLAATDVVFVLYIQKVFDVSPGVIGIIFAISAVGALVGGLTSARLIRRFGDIVPIAAGLLTAVGLGAIPLVPSVSVVTLALAASSLGVAVSSVYSATLRQRRIATGLLGRVTGASRAVAWGSVPLGALLGGVLGRQDVASPFLYSGLALLTGAFLLGWMHVRKRASWI